MRVHTHACVALKDGSLPAGEGCSPWLGANEVTGAEVVDECRQSIFILNEVSRNRGHPQEIS